MKKLKIFDKTKKEAKNLQEKAFPKVPLIRRQLDLIEKRFEVDEEKKIIIVPLRFEKVSDVLDTEVGNKAYPRFKKDVLEKVKEVVDEFPINFKTEVRFDIKDYEGYDPKVVMESFNETLELGQYLSHKKRRGNWLTAAGLILAGVIVLFVMAAGKTNSWFGDSLNESIITEIIDISAWVFIWEAVTILFVEPTEERTTAAKLRQKIGFISFYNGDEKLTIEAVDEIYKHWKDEGKVKHFGKACLLGASMAFIGMGFFTIYSTYSSISSQENMAAGTIAVTIVVAVISILLHFIAGFAGIQKYLGKDKGIARFVGPYSIFMLCVVVLLVIVCAASGDTKGLVSSISSSAISLFYIGGYFIDRYLN